MNRYRVFEDCQDEKGRTHSNFKWNAGSKAIYLFQMVSGHEFRISTKIKSESKILDSNTLTRVKKKANLIVTEELRREKKKEEVKILLTDVIKTIVDLYRKQRDAGSYSNGSFLAMDRAFRQLDVFWGPRFPDEITREEWDKFQDWYESKYPGHDHFNVTKYMRVLRSHCVEKGLIKNRPKITDRNAKDRRVKRKKKKARIYTDQEILSIDHACGTDLERLAVRLAYMMGFRISDCIQLEWSRIILDGECPVVTFSEGEDKADFSGKCPIPDDIVSILKILPHESKWVFPQKSKPDQHLKPQQFDFNRIKKTANITYGTFHSLRHYRLSRDFSDPSFTPAQVCMIRRVSMQTAMEHYVHCSERDLLSMRNTGGIKNMKIVKTSVSENSKNEENQSK